MINVEIISYTLKQYENIVIARNNYLVLIFEVWLCVYYFPKIGMAGENK